MLLTVTLDMFYGYKEQATTSKLTILFLTPIPTPTLLLILICYTQLLQDRIMHFVQSEQRKVHTNKR
jgi:hypothetical protein